MRSIATSVVAAAAALIAFAPAGAQVSSPAPAQKTVKERKYCIEYEKMTGSRVSQAECLTKAEWARRGVDVDELTKK